MTDKELLAAAVLKRSPFVTRYNAVETICRIGRWGTCVCCPDDQGRTYGQGRRLPLTENCPETDRSDHWIDYVNDDGTFYFDSKTVTRADLESFLLK